MSLSPAETVNALQHLFPNAVWGKDIVVKVVKDMVVEIVTPTPVTQKQLEDAAKLPRILPMPKLTPRQFKEQLIREGLKGTVLSIIANISDATEREIAQNWYDTAQVIERTHALINQIGAALGKTPAQIDTFFYEAAKL